VWQLREVQFNRTKHVDIGRFFTKEKIDRRVLRLVHARLEYYRSEEYADGGSKVGINRRLGRTASREGIDGKSTLFMVGEKKLFR
jgi:hypothetical protein